MQEYPTPTAELPAVRRTGWESWQVATVWVAGVVGALVAAVVSYVGGWIGVGISMVCTDRNLNGCPDGSTLTFLALGFPALVLVLSLFTALIAHRVRWLFIVACILLVLGPPVNLWVLSAMQP